MKWFSFFLALMVIIESSVPCCSREKEEAYTVISEIVHTGSTTNNEHQDDDCCKHCSPFLSCGTCTGFVFNAQFVVLEVEKYAEYEPTLYSIYKQFFLEEIHTSIWQPPKIS